MCYAFFFYSSYFKLALQFNGHPRKGNSNILTCDMDLCVRWFLCSKNDFLSSHSPTNDHQCYHRFVMNFNFSTYALQSFPPSVFSSTIRASPRQLMKAFQCFCDPDSLTVAHCYRVDVFQLVEYRSRLTTHLLTIRKCRT